jgi:GTP cyclohydrolase II
MKTSMVSGEASLFTKPSELRGIDPQILQVPGGFYVSDALNFYDDYGRRDYYDKLGQYRGRGLEDDEVYRLNDIRLHPQLRSPFPEREHSFHIIQGDPETEGAAFMVIVGDIEELQARRDGPLIRMHSACGYSEFGRELTNHLYKDPKWFYEQSAAGRFKPAFMATDEGLVTGYPALDEHQVSLDCDCRAQRQLSQLVIAAAGGIYVSLAGFPQEGRGYGTEIKEEAYKLQEHGLTTMQAFEALSLGAEPDKRKYGHVVRYLISLGFTELSALTNNPYKLEALAPFKVKEIPLMPGALTGEGRRYVASKRDLGHHVRYRTQFFFDNGGLTFKVAPADEEYPDVTVWSPKGLETYVQAPDKLLDWRTGKPFL